MCGAYTSRWLLNQPSLATWVGAFDLKWHTYTRTAGALGWGLTLNCSTGRENPSIATAISGVCASSPPDDKRMACGNWATQSGWPRSQPLRTSAAHTMR